MQPAALIKSTVKTQFMRNVLILVSGTGLAQLITAGVTPLLSRLYTPEAFGILGMFLAVTGTMAVFSTLKYEMAIPLPKEASEAASLVVLILVLSLASAFLAIPIVIIFGSLLDLKVTDNEWIVFVACTPLIVYFAGFSEAMHFWATRYKYFKRVSTSTVLRSSGVAAAQLLGGVLGLGVVGLLLGRVLGSFLGTGRLSAYILRKDWATLRQGATRARVKDAAVAHSAFPMFNMPRALLNALSQHLITIFIGIFFDPTAAGLYWFTVRLLRMPITLIGNAVRRVFYQKAAQLYNADKGLLEPLQKTTFLLGALAIGPIAVILLFGPSLFEFVFGSNWTDAGVYAQWLVIGWFARFVNVPSVMLVPVYGLQKRYLFLDAVRVSAELLVIPIAAYTAGDVAAIAGYSIIAFIGNALLIVYVFNYTRRREVRLKAQPS